jgi:hypothetical protein
MRYVVPILLVLVAAIHVLPISGVLGGDYLVALYGVAFTDANAEILMRHRAVLFGLLGALLLWAAFKPSWRTVAIVAGLLSVGSFVLLAWLVGGYNAQLLRVVRADWVALVLLFIALVLDRRPRAP